MGIVILRVRSNVSRRFLGGAVGASCVYTSSCFHALERHWKIHGHTERNTVRWQRADGKKSRGVDRGGKGWTVEKERESARARTSKGDGERGGERERTREKKKKEEREKEIKKENEKRVRVRN